MTPFVVKILLKRINYTQSPFFDIFKSNLYCRHIIFNRAPFSIAIEPTIFIEIMTQNPINGGIAASKSAICKIYSEKSIWQILIVFAKEIRVQKHDKKVDTDSLVNCHLNQYMNEDK